jgi:hypothetical protein
MLSISGLEITKRPERLSPSAFISSITCPMQFYFQKLSDHGWARDEQSLAAGVGTYFDILVKEALIAKGIPSSLSVELIRKSLTCKEPDVISIGQKVFDEYRKAGFIRDTKWIALEKHSVTPYKGVNLSGQLDATINIEGKECVLDFKVSGANSTAGVSPKQGYKALYRADCFFGEESSRKTKSGWEGPHKNFFEGIPFDEIDLTWAIQFCFYSWLLHPEEALERAFPVVVHSPIFNGKSKQLVFVVYEGLITVDFQRRLLARIDEFVWFLDRGYWKSPVKNKHVLKYHPMAALEIAYHVALGESWMTSVTL